MVKTNIDERRLLGASLIALGLSLAAASAVATVLALDHMAFAAGLCGPASGHCIRCVAAGATLIAALGAFSAGLSRLKPSGRLLPIQPGRP